jgi:hypothetical protein
MSGTKSPLSRLVLFMVCLSIAGALVAVIHYLAIDEPQQKAAIQAPENSAAYLCRYPLGYTEHKNCKAYECLKECCHTFGELTIVYDGGCQGFA